MKTFLPAAALALLLAGVATSPALAQAAAPAADAVFRATTLNLAADGEINAAPDMASINLGVTSIARSAAEALADNSTRMNQVVAALTKSGIAAKDIRTSGLNVSAQYAYEQNQPPRLTGYQASNQVAVTVHDLSRLGRAVDAAVAAGGNQVNGIAFGLNDPAAAEDAARERAVRALQAKAELYAKATGYRVLRLVSLSEGADFAAQPPRPMFSVAARSAVADQTVISPGELKVRVDVTGVYELAR
ncbi:MAG: SIMPL domain-containing protein [Caulobacterales bacterium]